MYRKTNPGFNLDVYVREGYRGDQDLVMFNDVVTKDQYGIRRHLRDKVKHIPIKTVVDCGGHIGSFGLLALGSFPAIEILIAVEPNEDSANLYQLNMEANGIKNAKVRNIGLSYNKKKNTMILGDDCTGISMLVTEEEARKAVKEDYVGSWDLIKCFGKECGRNRTYTIDSQNVKTITFEEFLEKENLKEIDILKLDCEGAECDIFINCKKESLNKAKIIICEFHYAKSGAVMFQQCKNKFENFTLMDLDYKSPVQWHERVGSFVAFRKDLSL